MIKILCLTTFLASSQQVQHLLEMSRPKNIYGDFPSLTSIGSLESTVSGLDWPPASSNSSKHYQTSLCHLKVCQHTCTNHFLDSGLAHTGVTVSQYHNRNFSMKMAEQLRLAIRITSPSSVDWYPVDDCRRAMLNQHFLAERQAIKGRQSSLLLPSHARNKTRK